MNLPLISIVIATYNSSRTLKKTLESIRKQSYPKNRIEILIIDGGSIDNTANLARKYQCKILENTKTDLIFGKHLGFLKAVGKYLLYLDSDEVLANPNSLMLKYSIFKKGSQVKAVISSGYQTPMNSSFINFYINEFGDPFTFFIYRESKGDKFLISNWSKKYLKLYENGNYIIFKFIKTSRLPLIELWAGGSMIDLHYTRSKFPKIKNNPELLAHLFYLLHNQKKLIAINKNDYIIHNSSESLTKYLNKIKSRVKNNIFKTEMGKGGFLGRQQFQYPSFRIKKYLFILYSVSIIYPSIDAIKLSLVRKKLLYLIHLPLSIYTTLLIIYYYLLKLLGIEVKIKGYGF